MSNQLSDVEVLCTLPMISALLPLRGKDVTVSRSGFDEFFRSDYPQVIGFLLKNGFDRGDAEDAAAESMSYAYKSWSNIDSPRSWVRQAAYNIACKQVRYVREAPRRAIAAGWVNSIHTDLDTVQIEEENKLLSQLLKKLPHKQRLVMAWHLDGFDDQEIAEHLGMNSATVRSARRHAREKLKKAYHASSAGPRQENSAEGEGVSDE